MIEDAVAAIRAGEPVVLPTDTVYGLCATPHGRKAARTVARLKGRAASVPLALLAGSADQLLAAVPELRGQALLAGPFTLVLPNPARRFSWLSGAATIGVRLPDLPQVTAAILAEAGPVLATSANRHGEPDPRRLEDVPEEIRAACGALVDGGTLPGTPSTVIDLTGAEPRILREGAVPAAEALARLRAAVGRPQYD